MRMFMYYVRGIGVSKDVHLNFPAANIQAAYDAVKSELGDKTTIAEITPLFEFDFDDNPSQIVRAN